MIGELVVRRSAHASPFAVCRHPCSTLYNFSGVQVGRMSKGGGAQHAAGVLVSYEVNATLSPAMSLNGSTASSLDVSMACTTCAACKSCLASDVAVLLCIHTCTCTHFYKCKPSVYAKVVRHTCIVRRCDGTHPPCEPAVRPAEPAPSPLVPWQTGTAQ